MTVIISLLRGVNVGGHNKIPMDALRELYKSLGLQEARTYIQSGNVVFRTENRDLVRLAILIESAIERKFGFRPGVVVRTCSEMRDVVARNPFAARADIDPRKLLVIFLAGDPGPEAREKVLALKMEPDELRIGHRELYIHYPDGMGRPRISWAAIEKTLKTSGTGRNWNSVLKLLEIGNAIQSAE